MSKVKLIPRKEIRIKNIKGYIERVVTPFGTGAKIVSPKQNKIYKVITAFFI